MNYMKSVKIIKNINMIKKNKITEFCKEIFIIIYYYNKSLFKKIKK